MSINRYNSGLPPTNLGEVRSAKILSSVEVQSRTREIIYFSQGFQMSARLYVSMDGGASFTAIDFPKTAEYDSSMGAKLGHFNNRYFLATRDFTASVFGRSTKLYTKVDIFNEDEEWQDITPNNITSTYSKIYRFDVFRNDIYLWTGNEQIYSTDGITWTLRTNPIVSNSMPQWTPQAGFLLNSGNSVRVSTNGTTWATGTLPASPTGGYVIASGRSGANTSPLYAAVSPGLNNTAAGSTDGITWISRTTPESNYYNEIIYGNDIFMAFRRGTWPPNGIISTDTVNWRRCNNVRETNDSSFYQDITFLNGRFLRLDYYPSPLLVRILQSYDGILWEVVSSGGSSEYPLMTTQDFSSLDIHGFNTNQDIIYTRNIR